MFPQFPLLSKWVQNTLSIFKSFIVIIIFLLPFCDYSKILQMEEEYIRKMCDEILALKPDLVITEKGVSDLAQHFLVKANISVIRRVRKTDNNRIARLVRNVGCHLSM
jgi:hypothetical protein